MDIGLLRSLIFCLGVGSRLAVALGVGSRLAVALGVGSRIHSFNVRLLDVGRLLILWAIRGLLGGDISLLRSIIFSLRVNWLSGIGLPGRFIFIFLGVGRSDVAFSFVNWPGDLIFSINWSRAINRL